MTDVIEDAQVYLQLAIEYLTTVLHSLLERVERNKHRPINRRTLVRWIAAFMPKQKDPRMVLQNQLGSSSSLKRWSSMTSMTSSLSSVHQWLEEEDMGGNFVHFRRASCSTDGGDEDGFENSAMPAPLAMLTSTPRSNFSSCSSLAAGDNTPSVKMSEMEEELAALRRQIAMLVVAQETSSHGNKTLTGTEESTSEVSLAADMALPISPHPSHLDDSGCESETVQRGPPSPEPHAPPAPPPPPPLPCMNPPAIRLHPSVSEPSFAHILNEKRSRLTQCDPEVRRGSVPDMAEVLRGLGNIRLRQVDRSPGGTPFRQKPRPHLANDPASIIAMALKKKFAAHRGRSPDSDMENDDSFDSPVTKHKSRRVSRRLSVHLDDDDSWTTLASPLKTHNV